jgi:hypothetical protein
MSKMTTSIAFYNVFSALFVLLNMLFQVSFIRSLLAVIYTLPSHTHESPTGYIPGLLTPLNHGKTSIHDPVLQPFVRLVKVKEGLAGARKKEIIMVTVTHDFRYNLDEDYIKTGMWSPYNIITAVVKRRCRPGTCNKRVCSRKRPFGVHNSDNDEETESYILQYVEIAYIQCTGGMQRAVWAY